MLRQYDLLKTDSILFDIALDYDLNMNSRIEELSNMNLGLHRVSTARQGI
jgi:hypothetical protein